MSDQKTYVKHVKTGEVFEVKSVFHDVMDTYDDHGEVRVFKREVLTPYDPEEAWEDCSANQVSHGLSGLIVCTEKEGWQSANSYYGRVITRDGKLVVQRRKT